MRGMMADGWEGWLNVLGDFRNFYTNTFASGVTHSIGGKTGHHSPKLSLSSIDRRIVAPTTQCLDHANRSVPLVTLPVHQVPATLTPIPLPSATEVHPRPSNIHLPVTGHRLRSPILEWPCPQWEVVVE